MSDALRDPGPGAGPRAGGAGTIRLETERLSKHYPGVGALQEVDFTLHHGEVHALFGENGAGKSTLITILAGANQPSAGRILFEGRPVELPTVHAARSLGISAVFQEFSLVPQLSVAENLFLGSEITVRGRIDKRAMRAEARTMLDRLGFSLALDRPVMDLGRAEQQMVEIAKAFRTQLSVLILDEPTASLTERETERMFALVDQARADGVSVVYVTHRTNEIRRLGDRITVLRDGRRIGTLDVAEASDERLITMMTGRPFAGLFPEVRHQPGRIVLETEGLTTASGSVRDAAITVRAGEIVGVAGLIGSGKSELARACFGIERLARGRVRFEGVDVTGQGPRKMLDRGFCYVPPDRREEGLVMDRSVVENVTLPALRLPEFSRAGFLRRRHERSRVGALAARMNLRPPDLDRSVGQFSGGNQQKILLAKALTREVRLFAFDEPTVGVDVATRIAIYRFIADLCEAGAGVLLVSSELPEILHLTRRVYVMFRGELRAELSGEAITETNVIRRFFERSAA